MELDQIILSENDKIFSEEHETDVNDYIIQWLYKISKNKILCNRTVYIIPKEILGSKNNNSIYSADIKKFLDNICEITDNEKDVVSCKTLLKKYINYYGIKDAILEKEFKSNLILILICSCSYKKILQWRDINGKKHCKRSIFLNIKIKTTPNLY